MSTILLFEKLTKIFLRYSKVLNVRSCRARPGTRFTENLHRHNTSLKRLRTCEQCDD